MKTFSISILFFLCLNVNNAQLLTDQFVHEIVALDSDEKKEAFLLNINELDQKVRLEKNDCEQKAYGSLKCAELRLKMGETDLENLVKIAMYLRLYDYPSKTSFTEKAASTPWLVLHHSVGSVPNWDKEFSPYLVKAWKNQYINTTNLHWYLKRYYSAYMGAPYVRDTTTNEEEDIVDLIKLLKLNDIK